MQTKKTREKYKLSFHLSSIYCVLSIVIVYRQFTKTLKTIPKYVGILLLCSQKGNGGWQSLRNLSFFFFPLKYGTLHEFACHPCTGAMLFFSVSLQFSICVTEASTWETYLQKDIELVSESFLIGTRICLFVNLAFPICVPLKSEDKRKRQNAMFCLI